MDATGKHSTMRRPAWGLAAFGWSDSHDERLWWQRHTAPDAGTTPPTRQPRVLLEMPGTVLPAVVETALREQGYEVAVCGGPAAAPYGCPITRGLRCPIADQADVIVFDLGLTTADGRAVWEGHEETHAVTPRILVQGVGDPSPRPRPGRQVVTGPLTKKILVDAIERALSGRGGPDPRLVSTSSPSA